MSKRKRNTNIVRNELFHIKLFRLLNLEQHNDIIEWCDDKRTIIIKNVKKVPHLFVSNYISKTKKLESIKKQFYLYRFEIENINNVIYKITHPVFRKNISEEELNSITRIKNIKSIYEEHKKEIQQIKNNRKKRKINIGGKSIEFCLDAVSFELENLDDIFDIEILEDIKINELIGYNIFRKDKLNIIMEQFDKYIKDCEFFEQVPELSISYNDICKFIK